MKNLVGSGCETAMVESARGLGSSMLSGAVSGIRDAFGRDQRAAVSGGGGETVTGHGGATPNGPRGRRMLAANTPVESLDRGAPRGTYLDILA
jgi:hypothetical protein